MNNKKVCAAISFLFVLLIIGCSPGVSPDLTDPETSSSFEQTTYVIYEKEGYRMESTTINHEKSYDLYEEWKKRQEILENEAKYEIIKERMQDKKGTTRAEQNLERYCNSLQSNSCLKMDKLETSRGYKEIEVSCNRFDSRNICLEHEVNIKNR